MPAYCDVMIRFLREDMTSDFMERFYSHINKCGMKYKSGAYEYEEDTLSETIAANQKVLDDNFMTDDGFRQTYFDYGNFSEVRGFWISNNYSVSYLIIFPEAEIMTPDLSRLMFRSAAVDMLSSLAEKLWEFPETKWIASETEIHDCELEEDVPKGTPLPQPYPFCITGSGSGYIIPGDYEVKKISRGGLLISDRSLCTSAFDNGGKA